MREILFRGKRVDNNEWVYGVPSKDNREETVIINNVFECEEYNCRGANCLYVDENTVGQFTGLTANGKKIFEGDIVVSRYPNGKVCSVGDIQFDCGVFGAEWTHHKKYRTMVGGFGQLHNLRRLDDDFIELIEVIGNIHDNPELLEVQNER